MKLPIEWLNEYVSTEGYSPKELADKLLNIGFEVEEIIDLGKDIDRVVTGKILEIGKHPDADKLQICKVNVGETETTIVTGAQNIAVGNTVPVALDGATLPGGKKILSAPLRGVMSHGMLCSGKELGIDNSVIDGAETDGILILPEIASGTDIKEVLRLNDFVLDISVTANRPDCQSVYGMAREVAAVLGRKLKPLRLTYKTVPSDMQPTITIEDETCSKYTCQIIKKVKIKPSPQWMRDRLRKVGIRPINNVVDITNYVLCEVGQPLHAFDTTFVFDCGIIVRKAKDGEKITALDEKTYSLNANMTVIADKEKALAIAGVMGGEYSGITENTTSVLLESARFSKGSVRATSRALGLRSDSSARYEKGVDYLSVETGRQRALALFTQLKAGTVTDAYAVAETAKPVPLTIKTSVQNISRLLGIEIDCNVICKVLRSLTFDVKNSNGNLTVKVPLFREDVDNYTDLAEEIIRYYGYDNIRSTFLPTAKTTAGGLDTRQTNISLIKTLLCGLGAYEISTFSIIGKKAVDKLNLPANSILRRQIEILNPLGEEFSLMRTQLVYNMLNVLAYNFSKKNRDFRLFEIGKVYLPQQLPLQQLPDERDTLCMAFTGKGESFYTVKAVATEIFRKFRLTPALRQEPIPYLHPGMSCAFVLNDKIVCTLGKLHPGVAKNYDMSEDVYLLEMDIHCFIDTPIPNTAFIPLPKFQPVERDLAVIVKEDVPVGDLLHIAQAADTLCTHIALFDVYQGEQIETGYKSIAMSLTLSAPDKTLKEEEINSAVQNILSALSTEFNAKLR